MVIALSKMTHGITGIDQGSGEIRDLTERLNLIVRDGRELLADVIEGVDVNSMHCVHV